MLGVRAGVVAGGVVGVVGLAAIGIAAGWNALAIVIAAVLGLVAGVAVGQGLAWMRTTAGRVARIEAQQVRTSELLENAAIKVRLASLQDGLAEARREAREARESLGRDIEHARTTLGAAAKATASAGEASEKRVLAAVESTRANLRGRMEELAHRQSVERRQVRTLAVERTVRQTSLLECYLQLQRLVPMPLPMPRPGGWAASEDLLLWLVGDVLERRPRVVVDLGSGQSSVWMAGAMRAAGYDGVVIGVDHDEAYARATEDLGRSQGLGPWLRVVHAPLTPLDVDGRESSWYDISALETSELGISAIEGAAGVGLLCVDGPPSVDQADARWPALPLMRERLEPGARIILDDMVREGEQSIAADWEARFPELAARRLDFEKGALVLTVP